MKHLKFLISPVFMGILFVVFATAMAVATFLENDYGSPAAYGMVYGTRWFEIILILLAINLTGQLIVFKLFRKSRLPGALFHLSFIVMLAGAAITRYTGWEGSIHIREGEEQDRVLSSQNYLGYTVKDEEGNIVANHSEEFSMATARSSAFSKTISIGNTDYELSLARMVPNASLDIAPDPDGEPIISLFVNIKDAMMHGETHFLRKGETLSSSGITIGFDPAGEADLYITDSSGKFMVYAPKGMKEMSMMTREMTEIGPGKEIELKKMQILTLNEVRVILTEMSPAAKLEPVSVNAAEQNTGQNAFIFDLRSGGLEESIYLWVREAADTAAGSVIVDGKTFELSYGPKAVVLPFTIRLNDFILERYPGSNSPSGYKSDVVLIDSEENVEKPFMIYMNNILKYKGYRFYQSSYDMDEKGTILSVNHDVAGMVVTYAGYALLFLFIIISLLNRKSVFHTVTAGHWNSNLRKIVPTVAAFFVLSGLQVLNAQKLVPDKNVAEEFGKVLAQDQKGRTKPLFTLSNDILRKVTRENKFEGMTSMQVFLGIYLDFNNWKDVPMITISNNGMRSRLGLRGSKASFADLVDISGNGTYKIAQDVQGAYNKAPGQRSKYDKEVMKVDERVNIIYMIYNGNFMRLFPMRNGTTDWGTSADAMKTAENSMDSLFLQNIIPTLNAALGRTNTNNIKEIRDLIGSYQQRYAGYELPSPAKVKAELLYYKLNIFEKLFPFYATTGLIMLIGLIIMVIRGSKGPSLFVRIFAWLLFGGFILHTAGLALRWYISGHSPMSNGYESMLFISWVTLLAGFIFSRRSVFALSATGVLASMTLMVAHLSFMDPEITNLVPVLKSYWLTLHVSVITGSYGFLGLGAILGLISLILISLASGKNRERISATIDELTLINYKSLTLGLYLLTIGTFLGAVWANESWGRYWGWDPKETWSLITIIIYSIVIHSRFIPGMKDIFTFNLIALFAFSSVLMTYFGVNYYLSGLHSYAAGDPVPVPPFVYITVILLAGLSFFAHTKYQKSKSLKTL